MKDSQEELFPDETDNSGRNAGIYLDKGDIILNDVDANANEDKNVRWIFSINVYLKICIGAAIILTGCRKCFTEDSYRNTVKKKYYFSQVLCEIKNEKKITLMV